MQSILGSFGIAKKNNCFVAEIEHENIQLFGSNLLKSHCLAINLQTRLLRFYACGTLPLQLFTAQNTPRKHGPPPFSWSTIFCDQFA